MTTFFDSIFSDETPGSATLPLVDAPPPVDDEAVAVPSKVEWEADLAMVQAAIGSVGLLDAYRSAPAVDPGLVDDADVADDEDVELIYWHCGPVPQYVGSPTPLCSPPVKPFDPRRLSRVLSECDRCGSASFVDVPIHNGESVRRDCAVCNRFMGWPKWCGKTQKVLPAVPRSREPSEV